MVCPELVKYEEKCISDRSYKFNCKNCSIPHPWIHPKMKAWLHPCDCYKHKPSSDSLPNIQNA